MPEHTRLERLLSIVAPVKAGEGLTALVMMINLSLMMTAYYIIKPVREAMILQTAGPEIRTYASVAGTLGFLLLVPVYGTLAP